MKLFNRILSLLLVLVLVLSFAACDTTPDDTPNGDVTTTTPPITPDPGTTPNVDPLKNMSAEELIEYSTEQLKSVTAFMATIKTQVTETYDGTTAESENEATMYVSGFDPENPTDYSKMAMKMTMSGTETYDGEEVTSYTEIIVVDNTMYMSIASMGFTMKYKLSMDLAMSEGSVDMGADVEPDIQLPTLFKDVIKTEIDGGYEISFNTVDEEKLNELIAELLALADNEGMGDETDTEIKEVSGTMSFDQNGIPTAETTEFSLSLTAWETELSCRVESTYDFTSTIDPITAPADADTYYEITEDDLGSEME